MYVLKYTGQLETEIQLQNQVAATTLPPAQVKRPHYLVSVEERGAIRGEISNRIRFLLPS